MEDSPIFITTNAALIVFSVLGVCIWYSFFCFYDVPDSYVYTVKRFGRLKRCLTPGINFLLPFVEKVVTRVNTEPRFLRVKPCEILTRDNLVLNIKAVVLIRVADAIKVSLRNRQSGRNFDYIVTKGLKNAFLEVDSEMIVDSVKQVNSIIISSLKNPLAGMGFDLIDISWAGVNRDQQQDIFKLSKEAAFEDFKTDKAEIEQLEQYILSLKQSDTDLMDADAFLMTLSSLDKDLGDKDQSGSAGKLNETGAMGNMHDSGKAEKGIESRAIRDHAEAGDKISSGTGIVGKGNESEAMRDASGASHKINASVAVGKGNESGAVRDASGANSLINDSGTVDKINDSGNILEFKKHIDMLNAIDTSLDAASDALLSDKVKDKNETEIAEDAAEITGKKLKTDRQRQQEELDELSRQIETLENNAREHSSDAGAEAQMLAAESVHSGFSEVKQHSDLASDNEHKEDNPLSAAFTANSEVSSSLFDKKNDRSAPGDDESEEIFEHYLNIYKNISEKSKSSDLDSDKSS